MPLHPNDSADESEIWSAAGILMAATGIDDPYTARAQIAARADLLGVQDFDIASYVSWRGQLPT